MKKSIISMIFVGMMLIGTVNSFGSTYTKKSHFQSPKTEKVVKSTKKRNNDCDCMNCRKLDKKQNHNKQVVGGYSQQRNLTKQDKQLFKNTYKGKDKLIPVSVSTQVVNGTNYKYICKDKHGRKVTVTIYQSLPCYGGKSKVVSID